MNNTHTNGTPVNSSSMWEILVPTVNNEGRLIRTRYHRVWDANIRKLSHGLTILNPVMGQWVDPKGELFTERMIPVRIMCFRQDINKIIDFTMKHYDQNAVLAYMISSECILKYREI